MSENQTVAWSEMWPLAMTEARRSDSLHTDTLILVKEKCPDIQGYKKENQMNKTSSGQGEKRLMNSLLYWALNACQVLGKNMGHA